MKDAVDPSGVSWKVGRVWISRPPRFRRKKADPRYDARGEVGTEAIANVGELAATGASEAGFLWPVFVLGILALILWIVSPVLALFVEWIAGGLVITVTVAAKVLLRRPWIVEAAVVDAPGRRIRWHVIGWRRSGRVAEEVLEAVARGSRYESADASVIESLPSGWWKKKEPPGGGPSRKIPAASYSPTPSPGQYHRRWRA